MRLVKLRQRAGDRGFVILPYGEKFKVTNNATFKNLREFVCQDLDEVEQVISMLEENHGL